MKLSPSPTLFRTLLLLLGLFLLAATAHASDPEPGFGDVIDVRVVNLEVVVTAKGERVPGLSPEDFQLLVDGQEVPIEYFSEIYDGQANRETSVGGALPAAEPGEKVGTRYLVFVDDYFAVPAYRNRVLRKLEDQLHFLEPEDRMAIVAFDGQQVEMLSSWTRSLPELRGALAEAADRRGYGLHRYSEQRQFDTFNRRSNSRFAFFDYDGLDLQRYDEVAWQISRVVGGANSALRAFARPEGRKVMLLLSGGWPSSTLEWVTGEFGASAFFAESRLFEPLVNTANRLGYTLYPVDLNNDLRHSGVSAQYSSLNEATFMNNLDRRRDWLEEDALVFLAESTGGKAFLDGGALTALERTVEDTRSYYWFGFTPTWQENDEEHSIEVKVRRKGLKVRNRTSFSDLSRQTETSMLVESAQLFDLPLPGGSLSVLFGEPVKAGYKKVHLPVRLEIPLDQITIVPDSGGYSAQLELRVAATDEDGDTAPIGIFPVEVRGDEPPTPRGTAAFETQLKLRRKPHRLLISVFDPASGNMVSKRMAVSL